MTTKEKAILLLQATRARPRMYCGCKEAFLSRVSAILEVTLDTPYNLTFVNFYDKFSSEMKYSSEPVDAAWAEAVVDEALTLLK